MCQHSISYFTNIFQNVRLLVLKTNLLKIKSYAMISSVERRRFQDVYLISRNKTFGQKTVSPVVMTDVIALQNFFLYFRQLS